MGDTSSAIERTEVGSYFVANYPPFSVWSAEALAEARAALQEPPAAVPLGLYLHIPFCRKRCHFCYFRVYTDRNARQVEEYLDLLAAEWDRYLQFPAIAGRRLHFVYFGGGTPSFLSTSQLERLAGRLTARTPWDGAAEVTFECEPGTLSESKLAAIRRLGVTRLSLGVENFDDGILELNGRAHRSPEIYRVFEAARRLGFSQINIDLIAGMLGETDENWRVCVERTLALSPDSVTIYQMELPYNTTITANLLSGAQARDAVAGWDRKRRWVAEAFERLEAAGLQAGELPLGRAYTPSAEERLIREFILQMKRGAVRPGAFQEKFGVDPLVRFEPELASLDDEGMLAERSASRVSLTREGLLRVDALLHRFFLPQHRQIRYT
jgi:oxygen-independent coproporphyrinogen-3 oxidase